MAEVRPCIVVSEGNKEVEDKEMGGRHTVLTTIETPAKFHRFTDTHEFVDDKPFPCTRAIVEYEDGRLEEVEIQRVRFTDK